MAELIVLRQRRLLMWKPSQNSFMPQEQSVTVLVVDDEEPISSSIVELLGMSGFKTACAANAQACLAYLDAHPDTDIVLLDINLGAGMTGIDALPSIKERHKYTQVIMFTSIDSLDTGVECMKRGALDYMTKPFDEEEFLKKVPVALERKRMSQLNDLYLSILVHDLKNPLQCIAGALEYFREAVPALTSDDMLCRMMQVADAGVMGIRSIINNILGIAKLENGTLVPQPRSFDLRSELEPAIAVVRSKGAADSRRWEISFPGEGQCAVTNDKNLYLQVFTNVLANAVRFTPRNGVITVRFSMATPEMVQTSITNTGSFIPPHLREAVFDRFAGVSMAADALKGQNYGLGLTFSKMAVEAMGGRIWVEGESETPATTFHFTVKNLG